jgi:hypothetical protein
LPRQISGYAEGRSALRRLRQFPTTERVQIRSRRRQPERLVPAVYPEELVLAVPGVFRAGRSPRALAANSSRWDLYWGGPIHVSSAGIKCSTMSASLIGPSGSSTFRLSINAVSMSLAGSCFSSESAPGPFHHGIRRRGGTIFWSALPLRNGGSKRTFELTSSIVPRGTSFHRSVAL